MRIFGQNGEKNYEMCGILNLLFPFFKCFWSLSFFRSTFFGERRERRAGGGIYFTDAVEPVELRVQDGRVAVRCGVVRFGAMRRTRATLHMLRGSERCAMSTFKRRSSIGSGFE